MVVPLGPNHLSGGPCVQTPTVGALRVLVGWLLGFFSSAEAILVCLPHVGRYLAGIWHEVMLGALQPIFVLTTRSVTWRHASSA